VFSSWRFGGWLQPAACANRLQNAHPLFKKSWRQRQSPQQALACASVQTQISQAEAKLPFPPPAAALVTLWQTPSLAAATCPHSSQ